MKFITDGNKYVQLENVDFFEVTKDDKIFVKFNSGNYCSLDMNKDDFKVTLQRKCMSK